MNYKEELINKEVILTSEQKTLTVIDVIENKNFKEIKVSLSNGKTYYLYLGLTKNVFVFVDDKIQKSLLKEVSDCDSNEKQLEKQKEEIRKKAISENKEKAIIENKNKVVKTKRVKDPNIRIDRKNVAYKATYCDGNGNWFTAPCSSSCRNRNCSKNGGGRFCSTNSVCRRVIDGLSTDKDVYDAFNTSFLCYESRMLLDYKIYAGRDDDGTVRGWSLDNDRLVILTTVKPNQIEEERVIFAIFLINHSYDKDDEEASATSYPDCRLSLTEEESESMKYWDYAPGEGDNNIIQWKEGLLRYQTDEMCATVLRDVVRIIEKRNDPAQTEYARNFLNKFLNKIKMQEEDISEKHGARIK